MEAAWAAVKAAAVAVAAAERAEEGWEAAARVVEAHRAVAMVEVPRVAAVAMV